VIERVKVAEAIMDAPLRGTRDEELDLSVDGLPRARTALAEPSVDYFGRPSFPTRGSPLPVVSRIDAEKLRQHYVDWARELTAMLATEGFEVDVEGEDPQGLGKPIIVGDPRADGRRFTLTWQHDPGLRRYVLRMGPSPWSDETEEGSGLSPVRRRYVAQRTKVNESLLRIAVPRIGEERKGVVQRLIRWLRGAVPRHEEDAAAPGSLYRQALDLLELDGRVKWMNGHRCAAHLRFRERGHGFELSAYRGLTQAIAPIGSLKVLRSYVCAQDASVTAEDWALEETERISMGFISIREGNEVYFGERLAHGAWTPRALAELIRAVAERADAYEAALMGEDLR
jgi:hypothetical protein